MLSGHGHRLTRRIYPESWYLPLLHVGEDLLSLQLDGLVCDADDVLVLQVGH